jgi:hypothetical protein
MLVSDIDQITVEPGGTVQARRVDSELDGARLLSRRYFRWTLPPGSDLTEIPEQIANVCRKTWTPEVIAAYRASLPPRSQDDIDAQAAREYPKLAALRTKTPAQIAAWVEANVTDFASAKDAIKTLAVFACVMARRV